MTREQLARAELFRILPEFLRRVVNPRAAGVAWTSVVVDKLCTLLAVSTAAVILFVARATARRDCGARRSAQPPN